MATVLEEMAADYADQIRKIQPEGPYLLRRLSAGGLIAHALACELQGARRADRAAGDPRRLPGEGRAVRRRDARAHRGGRARRCARRRPGRAGRSGS
ncbi:thioesterase domain-containing protein [Streptomyces echinatus]|uniref:thioesterase domain-containing protein n=1 Tax=Streptomyces echinatus TaxID=67293 RepID=UPI0031E55D89